jgi:hypothetical protein
VTAIVRAEVTHACALEHGLPSGLHLAAAFSVAIGIWLADGPLLAVPQRAAIVAVENGTLPVGEIA